jgi:hypothetical protein
MCLIELYLEQIDIVSNLNAHYFRILKLWTVSTVWIEKPLKNRPIFMKTGEIGQNPFHRFSESRPVKFEIFKNLK